MNAQRLQQEYGVWGEHPDYPVKDWQYEVGNDETRAGYWEWVASEMELPDIENG